MGKGWAKKKRRGKILSRNWAVDLDVVRCREGGAQKKAGSAGEQLIGKLIGVIGFDGEMAGQDTPHRFNLPA